MMLPHFSSLRRAALAITAALSLAACNRAEYAMLPKSPAYLGSAPARVAPRPVAVEAAEPTAAPVVAEAPAAPAATELKVAPTNVAPRVAKPVTTAPVRPAAPMPAAPVAAPAVEAPIAIAPAAAPAKPNFVQRLAMKKVSKKLDKLMAQMPQLKQGDNTASTSRLDSNLRTGLILIAVGLVVAILSFISGIFGVIGAIIAVIGLLFIILWAIDQA